MRRLGRPLELLGPFDGVVQAAAALQASEVDAVLVHLPQLQAGWLEAADAAAPALAGVPKAVLYGFAAEAVCDAVASKGTALLREPQPDAVLAQWLHNFCNSTAAPRPAPGSVARGTEPLPPRRLTIWPPFTSSLARPCPTSA